MKYETVENYAGGLFQTRTAERQDVISPLDGTVISQVPLSDTADVEEAVRHAHQAFPAWSSRTSKQRADVFYRYRALLETNQDELAQLIHDENGKTVDEGRAEVVRAIEVTEFACALPQMVAGEVLEVSRGVECRVDRIPLGVVASIVPFNFPVMVPPWTIRRSPMA